MTIFNKKIEKWYIDILTYFSLLIPGMFFLYFTGNRAAKAALGNFMQNTGAVASYLLVTAVLIAFSYCTYEESLREASIWNKVQPYLLFLSAGVDFFVLLLNKNIVSICLMIGTLLALPMLFRPTAETIKRCMQLLALFLLMLCNMSLLAYQTSVFQGKVFYDLEVSVYLELLLAFLALVFFHYWDRLPKGMDLRKISMLKLQCRMKEVLFLFVIVFMGVVLGGNCWNNLPEEGCRLVIKKIALSLINELNSTESTFFVCVNRGVIAFGAVIYLTYILLKRMRRKYHPDKPVTNMLIVLMALFFIECLVWKLTIGNIFLHGVLCFFAFFMYEEKKKIIIIQGSCEYEKENDYESSNVVNNSELLSGDDNAGVCG